jgi:hypothetical protein
MAIDEWPACGVQVRLRAFLCHQVRQFLRPIQPAKRTRLRSLAALVRPSFASLRPFGIERAQGRPGVRHTHVFKEIGPPATRKQAAVTTGLAATSGLPCAMVLRLIRDLLGAPGFLATVAAHDADASARGHQRRGVRTTRFRRPHRCRSSTRKIARDGTDSVHRSPPPRIVTTRTSLCTRRVGDRQS